MSAFLMATVFSGMEDREVSALTESMMRSGNMIDLSGVPGIKVDKHSTGGVGDKTSLIAAPIAAAAGVIVPMMSGRALGHTGGTLDKLEVHPRIPHGSFRRQSSPSSCARSASVSSGRAMKSRPPTRSCTPCAMLRARWSPFR